MSVIKVTAENFDEVLSSGKPVLVDFWATWCGPCKMMSPVVDELAEEHPEIAVCKVNVDEESALASAFGIMSIPTFVAIQDEKIVGQVLGVRPKEQLLELFK